MLTTAIRQSFIPLAVRRLSRSAGKKERLIVGFKYVCMFVSVARWRAKNVQATIVINDIKERMTVWSHKISSLKIKQSDF